MMMMMELAEATAHVDVYIVASNNTGGGGPGGRARPARRRAPPPAQPPRPQTPTQRHFDDGQPRPCYPAINLPNGFAETGSPTNAVVLRAAVPRDWRSSRWPRRIRMPPAST